MLVLGMVVGFGDGCRCEMVVNRRQLSAEDGCGQADWLWVGDIVHGDNCRLGMVVGWGGLGVKNGCGCICEDGGGCRWWTMSMGSVVGWHLLWPVLVVTNCGLWSIVVR